MDKRRTDAAYCLARGIILGLPKIPRLPLSDTERLNREWASIRREANALPKDAAPEGGANG